MTTTKTLYRAANDQCVSQGCCFAESEQTARVYLDNPGFGGAKIWRCEVAPGRVLDLTGKSLDDAVDMLGVGHPGAIGLDEWLARTPRAADAAVALGYAWAIVDESYPEGTRTWICLLDSADTAAIEDEMVEV